MRVVMDTSVLVAGLRSGTGASRRWLDSILDRHRTLVLSVPLVVEYEGVLVRSEMQRATGLRANEIGELLDTLCALAEPVELHYRLRPVLRDPDDEVVLETAVVGRVDALLTFNVRDFAGAERFGIRISQPGPAWRQTAERKT